ncbi:MAG TPA: hypothetical protein VFI25_09080 [Planctomycetota bacterium]|jgi:hypothetical protein|nr:hypothetical protein [Planctomycetota bacterium]
MKRIFFSPATLSILCALAAAQAPVLSPLQLLPGDGAIGPAAGEQRSPALVPGGSGFLAVWQDGRTDLVADLLPGQGGFDVYAARLDPLGAPIDLLPIVVSETFGDQTRPRAAWNGQDWLVVWVNQEPTPFYYAPAIRAARVSAAGLLLDTTPILLPVPANIGQDLLFGVASDGSGWLVVWKDFVGATAVIRGSRISSQGTLLDTTPVTLAFPPSQPYNGDVVFGHGAYLVVWSHWTVAGNDDVFGRRFTPALAPLGGTFPIAADDDYDVWPSVATGPGGFLVAWENYNTCCVGGGGKVFGARLSPTGQVLDAAGILLSATTDVTIGRSPSACADGSQWYVTWTYESGASQQLHAARVSGAGAVLDPGGFLVQPTGSWQTESVVGAAPGGGALVAWTDDLAGGVDPYDVFAAPLTSGGQAGAATCVTLGAPAQVRPRLAWSGSDYLAVFTSRTSGSNRILGQRLDPSGNAIDAIPFEVAGASTALRFPAIAWDGNEHLVVWSEGSTVLGRRLDATGTPLDASPFPVMPGSAPDVAALGGDFLVVATHAPSNPQYRFPFAARVRGFDGLVLDPTPVQLGQFFALAPKVATFGGQWIAAWERHFSHDDPHANVHAAFVTASGTTPGEFALTGGSVYHNAVAVASDGASALVAWADNSPDIQSANLSARRVLPGGSMLPIFSINASANVQAFPALAWDGAEFVAAFEDHRNAALFFDLRSDLFGARVDAAGTLLDPTGFAVAAGAAPQMNPAVAGGSAGSAAIAGAHFGSGSPYASYRVGLRILDPPSPCAGSFATYGSGLLGTGGFVPALAGTGCPTIGSTIAWTISYGRGAAPGLLAYGASPASAPILGGTALVTPLLFFPFALGGTPGAAGAGSTTFGIGVPNDPAFAGTAHYTQAIVLDPLAPQGLAFTAGLVTQVE